MERRRARFCLLQKEGVSAPTTSTYIPQRDLLVVECIGLCVGRRRNSLAPVISWVIQVQRLDGTQIKAKLRNQLAVVYFAVRILIEKIERQKFARAMKVQNKNNTKNEVMEKGRKSTEKVFTTLLVDGRLLESEPSSQVSLSPLLLPTATTMGQFFWSNQQQTHSHLIFSEGITNMDCYYYYYNCSSYIRKENNFPCRIIIFEFIFDLK